MEQVLIAYGLTEFSALATRNRWKIVITNNGATMTVSSLRQFQSRALRTMKLQKKVRRQPQPAGSAPLREFVCAIIIAMKFVGLCGLFTYLKVPAYAEISR